MTYTDGIHLVADSLKELHQFAQEMGLKRERYHGHRKGHPHYDLLTVREAFKAGYSGAGLVNSRRALIISQYAHRISKF